MPVEFPIGAPSQLSSRLATGRRAARRRLTRPPVPSQRRVAHRRAARAVASRPLSPGLTSLRLGRVVSPSLIFRTDVHRVHKPASGYCRTRTKPADRSRRQNLALGEAGKGEDDAATFDAEPSPPVGRFDVADVGTPGSVFLPAMAKAGDGMPQRAIAISRTTSFAVRTIGAE